MVLESAADDVTPILKWIYGISGGVKRVRPVGENAGGSQHSSAVLRIAGGRFVTSAQQEAGRASGPAEPEQEDRPTEAAQGTTDPRQSAPHGAE